MNQNNKIFLKNKSIINDDDVNNALLSIGKKSKDKITKNIINNLVKTESDKKNKSTTIKDYDRPTSTFTEKLSQNEIEKKLEDYKKVEDIYQVPLNTHLRYFIKKDDEMVFRMGGILKKNSELPKYVILKNAEGIEWSVQIKDTIFFKKMSINEIKAEYEKIIDDLNLKLKKLKDKIKQLEK